MYYPTDPIENLKGVGKWTGENFKKASIKTVGDLLNYFPFRHEDLSVIQKISEVNVEDKVVLKGNFKRISTFLTKTKKRLTKAKFYDKSGELEITWFSAPYIQSQLNEEDTYHITGKITKFGNKNTIVNPQIEKSEKTTAHIGRIVPIYFNIPNIYMKTIRKSMLEAVKNTKIDDFLEDLEDFMSLNQAYTEIHFPTSFESVERAKDRIALDELIHVKLHSEKQKQINKKLKTNFNTKKDYSESFIKKLPFNLTKDQVSSIKIINEQLSKKSPMNVLLSGDVGSGKTIVSIVSAYNTLKNKGKVVYLAPTVVLANQVYKEYSKFLSEKYNIELVTSQTNNKKFKEGIKADILIGTHALLNVEGLSEFANLVVIDEQHKFGVKQRAKIIESTNPPHVLTMTATPIPRSMALAFFGEMVVAQIKTKPKGRKLIKTKVLPESKRKACYTWIKNEVIKENKVYHIVPFIEVSEAENFKDVKSVEEVYPKLAKEFGKSKVLLLHGKMKDDEKNEVIAKFKEQKGGILLSTQVVEVGVDVKEATVIIIESAERFGLASLHQLRGRVGRNDLQSYCFLFASNDQKGNATRLKNMEKENDGFRLAQLDLENRGSGEIFGIRQSGEVDLKFVDFKNTKLIEQATIQAQNIFENPEKLKKYTANYFTRDFFYIKDN